MTVRGIDISHNNGTVNFDRLGADVRFLYCKATEGTGFVDPAYTRHVAEAKRTMRLQGAYHFLDTTDPAAQARHFASVIGKPGAGHLPPVVDVEAAVLRYGGVELARRVRTFLATADNLTGRTCGIYLSDSTIDLIGGAWSSLSAGRLIWVARYSTSAPTHPWHMWQYDGTGMDLDVFNGTQADLEKWAQVTTGPRTLRLTHPMMHGADVTAVQVALGRHRFTVTVDSYYGAQTAAAVLAFKKTIAWLPHNSIVGNGTRKALGL